MGGGGAVSGWEVMGGGGAVSGWEVMGGGGAWWVWILGSVWRRRTKKEGEKCTAATVVFGRMVKK
jgi:hypothetical protein